MTARRTLKAIRATLKHKPRTCRFELAVSADELKRWREAAVRDERSLASWIRKTLNIALASIGMIVGCGDNLYPLADASHVNPDSPHGCELRKVDRGDALCCQLACADDLTFASICGVVGHCIRYRCPTTDGGFYQPAICIPPAVCDC